MINELAAYVSYFSCAGKWQNSPLWQELNTYFSLWKEDSRESIDAVLDRTLEVLPIMSTLEALIENPDEWEIPLAAERSSRSYKSKVQERIKIFNDMKSLQLKKLNRATYDLLLDVSPMVDQESNVLQHFLSSDLVSGTLFLKLTQPFQHKSIFSTVFPRNYFFCEDKLGRRYTYI